MTSQEGSAVLIGEVQHDLSFFFFFFFLCNSGIAPVLDLAVVGRRVPSTITVVPKISSGLRTSGHKRNHHGCLCSRFRMWHEGNPC